MGQGVWTYSMKYQHAGAQRALSVFFYIYNYKLINEQRVGNGCVVRVFLISYTETAWMLRVRPLD